MLKFVDQRAYIPTTDSINFNLSSLGQLDSNIKFDFQIYSDNIPSSFQFFEFRTANGQISYLLQGHRDKTQSNLFIPTIQLSSLTQLDIFNPIRVKFHHFLCFSNLEPFRFKYHIFLYGQRTHHNRSIQTYYQVN